MKRKMRCLAALSVVALLGAMLAGCSGQQSGSAASSSTEAASPAAESSAPAAEPTPEELIAELESVKGVGDVESVTINMDGEVTMDLQAIANAVAAEAAEAAAEASSEEAADVEVVAGNSGESVEPTSVPFGATALYEKAGDSFKVKADIETMGISQELYIDGDNIVIVSGDQAFSATPEEVGLGEYVDPQSLMDSQGANLDKVKDSIKSIKKTVEGDYTVYTLECDPEKFMAANADAGTLSQFGDYATFDEVSMTYRVDASGTLVDTDVVISGTGLSLDMSMTCTDINATTVPDAPEATASYSDYLSILGSDATSALDDVDLSELGNVAEEATAEAEAA